MKYTIVKNHKISDFVEKVRDHVRCGWVPQGGVNITDTSSGLIYAQAMVIQPEKE